MCSEELQVEPYHAKMGLKLFDAVIAKEGLAAAAKPSFGVTLTTENELT